MIIDRDVAVPTDDGTVLRADVYRPDTTEPVPVLMTLGPYGKGVQYKDGYAPQWDWLVTTHPGILPGSTRAYMAWETVDPETWVPWGYAVVRVDSRGAGRSPGRLDIMSPREVRDYYDAIEWAGIQPWSSGKVGLIGISYYAINQWLVASLQPPHLAAMVPWEGAADFYRDWGPPVRRNSPMRSSSPTAVTQSPISSHTNSTAPSTATARPTGRR
ncbi:CocE/NonD family hydrolase [Streptomyces sp. 5-6(2022)]|uniref:CocE/NonD family hydrolase n=1 Tax=Streptomyces sp. 5-6(2022) TaxID=2936510 RepID=UPI0023B9BA2A|nr:CocE/NonD family hydrolase [Streptomyces sp. 5-6(2022)]